MAFRKTIRNNYQPSMCCGGFAERKSCPVECGNGLNTVEVQDVPMTEVSKSSLPLLTLDAVLASGKPIEGNVSFAPTDPATFESVETFLGDYAEVIQSQDQTISES